MTSTNDLVRIVSVGGGIIIDSSRAPDDLVRIASSASAHKSRVVIKGAGKYTPDDLVRIASAGKGAVIFDFSD
jgi:predicted RNA-binding protein YlxR (DUF448 family)